MAWLFHNQFDHPLDDLMRLLLHPDCQVETLCFFPHPIPRGPFREGIYRLLKTVVECEHSRISTVRFKAMWFSGREGQFVNQLLNHRPEGSKTRKITSLIVDHSRSRRIYLTPRAETVLISRHLQRLEHFTYNCGSLSDSRDAFVFRHLAHALEKKGNRLRSLMLARGEHLSPEVANALRHENCKLRRLDVYEVGKRLNESPTLPFLYESSDLLPSIATFLNDPKCMLKHLTYRTQSGGDKESLHVKWHKRLAAGRAWKR